jgi:NAD(P)-dependent dehydrogenase (short-subunit alcohol dehydrogenase family)
VARRGRHCADWPSWPERRFGAVDIAVANAGIELIGIPFLDVTE